MILGKCIGYGEILIKDGKMFVKIMKLGEGSFLWELGSDKKWVIN